jgi:hypothetical protein
MVHNGPVRRINVSGDSELSRLRSAHDQAPFEADRLQAPVEAITYCFKRPNIALKPPPATPNPNQCSTPTICPPCQNPLVLTPSPYPFVSCHPVSLVVPSCRKVTVVAHQHRRQPRLHLAVTGVEAGGTLKPRLGQGAPISSLRTACHRPHRPFRFWCSLWFLFRGFPLAGRRCDRDTRFVLPFFFFLLSFVVSPK